MTKLYGGIDLHANNSVIVLVDDQEQVVYEKRMPNDLSNNSCSTQSFSTTHSWPRRGIHL